MNISNIAGTIRKRALRVKLFFFIFFTVGLCGIMIPSTRSVFLHLTPLALLLSITGLAIFHTPGQNRRTLLVFVSIYFASWLIEAAGVNGGFMEVGARLGIKLASMESSVPSLIVAVLLGLTTVLAEPAVHVLTNQVEEVTGGSVKRQLVLIFMSVAVGSAIFLSALRILIPGIQLWMYLLPGFGLAIVLSYFVPDLFVGMAFDAGGVASGPMTATFSLAFVQGMAAQVPGADVVADGFGMIAIVAMMPIIAIELLGALYQIQLRKAAKSVKKSSS